GVRGPGPDVGGRPGGRGPRPGARGGGGGGEPGPPGGAPIEVLVAARPSGSGGWELAVIRAGRLASAGVAERGVPPMPVVEALTLAAETVLEEPSPLRGATAGEAGLIATWLESPGVRIVRASHGYADPARGGGGWLEWCALARAAV
ncbi:hypothetical protein ACFWPB_20980, partial [Rhodococcus sp. NPDC058514]